MRLMRVHASTRKPAGKHFPRRPPRRRLVPAATAAALVLGSVAAVAAVAAREATTSGALTTVAEQQSSVTGRRAAVAQPTSSPSQAPAPLGTGIVAPAVKPYLAPKLLKAVPVGPGPVSKPVKMVLTSSTVTTALDDSGIPQVAVEAYKHVAERIEAFTDRRGPATGPS